MSLNLIPKPKIILVANKDKITFGKGQTFFKISGIAQAAPIPDHSHVQRGVEGKIVRDNTGIID
jgi:hypothetical protein